MATHGGVVTARGDTSVEAAEVAGSCASLERVCVRPGDPARPLGRRRCPVSWGVGGQGRAVPDESAPCRAARQAHPRVVVLGSGPEAGGCGSRGSCARTGQAERGGAAQGTEHRVTEVQSGRGERGSSSASGLAS